MYTAVFGIVHRPYLAGLPWTCPLLALWDEGIDLPLFLLGEGKGVDPLVSRMMDGLWQTVCLLLALWSS